MQFRPGDYSQLRFSSTETNFKSKPNGLEANMYRREGHVTLVVNRDELVSKRDAIKAELHAPRDLHTQFTFQVVGELPFSQMQILDELLDEGCTITGLDLSGCLIGDTGLKQLLPKFISLAHLTHLNLRLNHLGCEGIQSLVELFPHWTNQLVALELGLNNIGAVGMQLLARELPTLSRLETLDVRRCGLGDDGLKHLSLALPKLKSIKHLDVGLNKASYHVVAEFAKALATLTALTYFDYSGNDVRSKGAPFLAESIGQLRSLQTLILQTCKLSKAALSLGKALEHHSALTSINLDDNKLGNSGMECIAQGLHNCKGLQTLSAASNRIGTKGVEAIAALLHTLDHVKHINLSDNAIGDYDIAKLAPALGRQKELIRCEFAENSIEAKGAEILIAALKETETFTHLDLSENNISSLSGSLAPRWKLKL